jgi:Beta-lactamase
VIKDGALVAQGYSGVADPVSGEPVSAGTLFGAGSTAKGVLSSLLHAVVAALGGARARRPNTPIVTALRLPQDYGQPRPEW